MMTTTHQVRRARTAAALVPRRATLGPGRGRRTARTSRFRTALSAAGRSRSWWRELGLLAVLYVAYAASRLASFAPAGAEVRNGNWVMGLERALQVHPERALNDWLYEAPRWVGVAASYFYMTMHYLLTVVTLIWLFRTSNAAYRRARAWLVAMTFPALIVFWLFPVAPPRTMPGNGAHDIVADQHRYGWWGSGGGTAPRGFSSLVNENAAMPSLHVGWAIWVGWNLVHSSRNPFVRAFGYAYPLITMTVVISTGNHYLLDIVAGALLAVAAEVFVDRVVPKLCRRPAASAVAAPRLEPRSPAQTSAHGRRRSVRGARTVSAARQPGNRR